MTDDDQWRHQRRSVKVLKHQIVSVVTPDQIRVLLNILERVAETSIESCEKNSSNPTRSNTTPLNFLSLQNCGTQINYLKYQINQH